MTVFCARCGLPYIWIASDGDYEPVCRHSNTADPSILLEEAMRIRARYEIGRRFNPNHDETSYRDGNKEAP